MALEHLKALLEGLQIPDAEKWLEFPPEYLKQLGHTIATQANLARPRHEVPAGAYMDKLPENKG